MITPAQNIAPRFREINSVTESTSLQGYITTSFSKLVEKFGEPVESDGYKVSSEWLCEYIDWTKFTVYDYKETELYNPDYPTVEDFRSLPSHQWHIGAANPLPPNFIQELEEYLNAPVQ